MAIRKGKGKGKSKKEETKKATKTVSKKEEPKKAAKPVAQKKEETKAVAKRPAPTGRSAEVRAQILDAKQDIEGGYVKLASLLTEAYDKEFFLDWGYDDFKKYAQEELQTHPSKAESLVRIYKRAQELSLDKKRIEKIGWTRVREVVGSMTSENKDELLNLAEKTPTQKLIKEMKDRRIKDGTARPGARIDGAGEQKLNLTMSTEEANVINAAIEEAKMLINSSNTVMALEHICLEWSQANDGTNPPTLQSLIDYAKKVYGAELVVANETEIAAPIEAEVTGTSEEDVEYISEEDVNNLKSLKDAKKFIKDNGIDVVVGKKDKLDDVKKNIIAAISAEETIESNWSDELDAVDDFEKLAVFIEEWDIQGFDIDADGDIEEQVEALRAKLEEATGVEETEEDEIDAILGD